MSSSLAFILIYGVSATKSQQASNLSIVRTFTMLTRPYLFPALSSLTPLHIESRRRSKHGNIILIKTNGAFCYLYVDEGNHLIAL